MFTAINQVVLPLNIGYAIPKDDPVIILSELCDELDYSRICEKYLRNWRKHSPKTLFKIIVYAYMRNIYSSREIETACNRDICFMWLLNNEPTPDHSTITRFISDKLAPEIEDLFYQLINKLYELGEIKFENLFVDGTKIEANANRYTFVWAKSVEKNAEKLRIKIDNFLEILTDRYLVKFKTAEEYYEFLARRIAALNMVFVHGKGKRKTQLQRDFEILEEYLERKQKYKEYFRTLNGRKSFSKTDTDATFMRMKEDHMLNGQLKPGYNVQIGVENEYILGVGLFPNPTDVTTLIPFLERVRNRTGRIISNIIADAGYESEENYLYLDRNGQLAFIKPTNFEISKTRSYRSDISRKENMQYDEERDVYICRNSKELVATHARHSKSSNGYVLETTIYTCSSCKGCPYKTSCIKGNNCKTPMEERNKVLQVSKKKEQFRKACLERLVSDRGVQLRMNRSIQVEGSFAIIKEDMNFRRYSYRGKDNVLTQSMLMAMAFNMNKLHHKIQNNRTGTHLFEVQISA